MDFGAIVRPIVNSCFLCLGSLATVVSSAVTQQSQDASQPPEMLMTEQGFLAIDTPKGWMRTDGPGLAYFIPGSHSGGGPRVWIYISSASIGSNEESKDLKSYIESDIASFRKRFKQGVVQQEKPLSLPHAKLQAPVYTFVSGEEHNAIEQVVYVPNVNRVLTLVLSAKDKIAFAEALPVFRDFAKSYRGSITPETGSVVIPKNVSALEASWRPNAL